MRTSGHASEVIGGGTDAFCDGFLFEPFAAAPCRALASAGCFPPDTCFTIDDDVMALNTEEPADGVAALGAICSFRTCHTFTGGFAGASNPLAAAVGGAGSTLLAGDSHPAADDAMCKSSVPDCDGCEGDLTEVGTLLSTLLVPKKGEDGTAGASLARNAAVGLFDCAAAGFVVGVSAPLPPPLLLAPFIFFADRHEGAAALAAAFDSPLSIAPPRCCCCCLTLSCFFVLVTSCQPPSSQAESASAPARDAGFGVLPDVAPDPPDAAVLSRFFLPPPASFEDVAVAVPLACAAADVDADAVFRSDPRGGACDVVCTELDVEEADTPDVGNCGRVEPFAAAVDVDVDDELAVTAARTRSLFQPDDSALKAEPRADDEG